MTWLSELKKVIEEADPVEREKKLSEWTYRWVAEFTGTCEIDSRMRKMFPAAEVDRIVDREMRAMERKLGDIILSDDPIHGGKDQPVVVSKDATAQRLVKDADGNDFLADIIEYKVAALRVRPASLAYMEEKAPRVCVNVRSETFRE